MMYKHVFQNNKTNLFNFPLSRELIIWSLINKFPSAAVPVIKHITSDLSSHLPLGVKQRTLSSFDKYNGCREDRIIREIGERGIAEKEGRRGE